MANKEHRVKQSLGLLEVCDAALAISCADIMAKSASIAARLERRTNSSGWMGGIKLPVWPPFRRLSPPVRIRRTAGGTVAPEVIRRGGGEDPARETPHLRH